MEGGGKSYFYGGQCASCLGLTHSQLCSNFTLMEPAAMPFTTLIHQQLGAAAELQLNPIF